MMIYGGGEERGMEGSGVLNNLLIFHLISSGV